MATYIVAQLAIHDRDEYAKYESGFMDIFAQHRGTMLAVDETVHVLEGDWPFTRTVLIEFPSQADADAWYRSDAYQRLMVHRTAASAGNIVTVQGLAG